MSNQQHRYRIMLDYIEPWLDEQDDATSADLRRPFGA